jgi:hypothetical protein
MIDPQHDLPMCAPGDAVAVSGRPLLDETRARYTQLGADVVPLAEAGAATADLILLDSPAASELRSAEVALRPGGTIAIRGAPAADASLGAPHAVHSELRIEFLGDDDAN